MSRRIALSPFMRDMAITGLCLAAAIVATIWATRWTALALPTAEFGVFGISRRAAAALGALGVVLGVGVTRFGAQAGEPVEQQRWLDGALQVLLLAHAGMLLVALLLGHWLSLFLFDEPGREGVVLSCVLLSLATGFYTLRYAWHRGRQEFLAASFWQMWSLGVVPIVTTLLYARTGRVDWLNNSAALGTAAPGLLPIFGMMRRRDGARRASAYGFALPRLPGEFSFSGLLAIGPLLAPRVGGLASAGYLVVGQSVLRVLESATRVFSIVALPKVAGLVAADQREFLRQRVSDLVALVLQGGVFAGVTLFVWADVLVLTWLGPRYEVAIPVVRVFMVAAPLYLGYAGLRSVVDGLDPRPINARNILLGTAVTALLSLASVALGVGVGGLAWATAAGLATMGSLSLHHLHRSLGLDPRQAHWLPGIAWALVCGLLQWAARAWAPAPAGPAIAFAGIVGASLLWLAGTWRLQVRWMREAALRVVR